VAQRVETRCNGAEPRLAMLAWLSTLPLPLGKTSPSLPFGQASRHSRSVLTTLGDIGISGVLRQRDLTSAGARVLLEYLAFFLLFFTQLARSDVLY
jgi:hypothetical protein